LFDLVGLRLSCCVWLVALARTKLTKENEPEEIPQELPSRLEPSNWLYTS